VVICTRDRAAQLDQCLEATTRLNYPRFDVVVVDNAPQGGQTQEVVARHGVRYVVEPVAGLSRARNRGALACDTEIVAFLDDDALPEPDWLSALALEFRDPLVMAVAGRVRPARAETEAEHLGAVVAGLDSYGQQRKVIDLQTPHWFEIANFGGIGTGGNLALRRQAFNVWPGFDERLGRGAPLPGSEEHHAFFELIDRGYRVIYTPQAVLWHPCPRTWDELRTRYLKMVASAAGYITLLFVEEPRYWRATLRYVGGVLKGTSRTWRSPGLTSRPRIVPRWRALLACLLGPALYVRSSLFHQAKTKHA